MNRFALIIHLSLIVVLTLPAIPLDHLFAMDLHAASQQESDACGCPSQEREHEENETAGKCDSDCDCTCHLSLNAALLHFDYTCELACDPIIEQQPLLPPSFSPSQLERPPRS